MVTIADAINKLSRRVNSFRVLEVDETRLLFVLGSHKHSFFVFAQNVMELSNSKYEATTHSAWAEGLILGKVRNDAGELVTQVAVFKTSENQAVAAAPSTTPAPAPSAHAEFVEEDDDFFAEDPAPSALPKAVGWDDF